MPPSRNPLLPRAPVCPSLSPSSNLGLAATIYMIRWQWVSLLSPLVYLMLPQEEEGRKVNLPGTVSMVTWDVTGIGPAAGMWRNGSEGFSGPFSLLLSSGNLHKDITQSRGSSSGIQDATLALHLSSAIWQLLTAPQNYTVFGGKSKVQPKAIKQDHKTLTYQTIHPADVVICWDTIRMLY